MTDPADLLALARAARGFMPDHEGLALHRLARERLPHGPVLEVGTYCGKSAVYLGAAARDLGGGTVFTVDHHRGSEEIQPGWEHHDPEVFEQASPILRVTEDAPDFFVLHGARDSLVAVEQARLFVAALRETSKNSVAYAEFPGTQHAFDVFPSIRSEHVVRAVQRYLEWHRARR